MKNRGSGRADPFHDPSAEQASLEAQRVHHPIPGLAERGRGDRVGDAQRHDELVLPVERTAVVVVSAALDDLVALRPFRQLLDAVRQHGHIVVHHPEPGGAQLVRLLHTGREPARAAEVVGLRRIHHAAPVAAQVGHRIAPLAFDIGGEPLDHAARLVAVLIVHNDDAPRRLGQVQQRLEQGVQQLLPLVGHHHDRQLLDPRLLGMSRLRAVLLAYSHVLHCCTHRRHRATVARIVRHAAAPPPFVPRWLYEWKRKFQGRCNSLLAVTAQPGFITVAAGARDPRMRPIRCDSGANGYSPDGRNEVLA